MPDFPVTAEPGGDNVEDPAAFWRFGRDGDVELGGFGSRAAPAFGLIMVFFLTLPDVDTTFFNSSSCLNNGSDAVPTAVFVGDAAP